jgi:POT family proton-dependent oligopeptide transporter
MGSLMGEGEGGNMTREGALEAYWNMGLVAIGIGVAVMIVSPLVKKWMHLDTLKDEAPVADADAADFPATARPAE